MKFRTGFVSNSSSSSFCILGKIWRNKKIEQIWNRKYPNMPIDTYVEYFDPEGSFCHSFLNDHGLKVTRGLDGLGRDITVMGVYAEHLREDKTIEELKKGVAEAINLLLGINLNESHIKFITDGGFA